MDGKYRRYDYVASAGRIDEILNQPAGQFEEVSSLPDRSKLTFTNGYYAYCSSIFVDIRDSSGLTSHYKRPALAKLYRSFISEMVAVLNSDTLVREVNIVGDCVWSVYNTPSKTDIDDVFGLAYTANTLKKLLKYKLQKHGYDTAIKLGIGLDYGRALMIKAGYAGSGINDVIYMGDVVNRAAHLAHKAGRNWVDPIWVGETFAQNLNDQNQGMLRASSSWELGIYRTGDVVRTDMNDWIESLS